MKADDKFDPQIAAIAKPDPAHNPLVILGQALRGYAKDALALKKQELGIMAAMKSVYGGTGGGAAPAGHARRRRTGRRRGRRAVSAAAPAPKPTGMTGYLQAISSPANPQQVEKPFVPQLNLLQVRNKRGQIVDLIGGE